MNKELTPEDIETLPAHALLLEESYKNGQWEEAFFLPDLWASYADDVRKTLKYWIIQGKKKYYPIA
jgi:hypothetical protein